MSRATFKRARRLSLFFFPPFHDARTEEGQADFGAARAPFSPLSFFFFFCGEEWYTKRCQEGMKWIDGIVPSPPPRRVRKCWDAESTISRRASAAFNIFSPLPPFLFLFFFSRFSQAQWIAAIPRALHLLPLLPFPFPSFFFFFPREVRAMQKIFSRTRYMNGRGRCLLSPPPFFLFFFWPEERERAPRHPTAPPRIRFLPRAPSYFPFSFFFPQSVGRENGGTSRKTPPSSSSPSSPPLFFSTT